MDTEVVAESMSVLGKKLIGRQVPEEIARFASLNYLAIDTNPLAAFGASYAAKVDTKGNGIAFDPGVFTKKSDLVRWNAVAHELRHILSSNLALREAGSHIQNGIDTPWEVDARDYAEELFPKRTRKLRKEAERVR